MENMELDARERILKAAMELLDKEKDAGKITVRLIAEKAGVGIGLINYHFRSKEKLLNEAVGTTMAGMAEELKKLGSGAGSPVDKLKQMLKQLSDFAIRYQKHMRISIEYEILQGDMQVPVYILPVLREIYGREKDERELRLIAFTIITGMQVMYMKTEAFYKYSGIDITNEKQRSEAIDIMISNFIGK